MQAYRTETRIETNGNLIVRSLPFPPGEEVEVIVLPRSKEITPLSSAPARNPLRGSVIRYDHPTDPVDEGEWESA